MDKLNKMKLYGLTALSLLLAPLGAQAQVDGKATAADGYTVGYMFDLGYNGVNCATNAGDCGTLMVNDSGGMVQFALILPQSLKDNTYGTNSTDYDPSAAFKAQAFKDLTGSDKLIVGLNGNTLTMDFLQGFASKDDGPVYKSGFTGAESSPTDATKPAWALAAATSMEYNYKASNPNGVVAPAHFGTGTNSPGAGDAAMAFWEFQHIYEWKVQESIFKNGSFDISQVGIDQIHLSPKRIDFDDTPTLEPCSPTNPKNCLPDPCTPGTPGCGGGGGGGQVPLPGTLVLMLMGLGILGGRGVAVRKSVSVPKSKLLS